jgi:hypothetical protein
VATLSRTVDLLVAVASLGMASISGELLRRSTGSEGEIGRRYGAMLSSEVARRGREERGRRWCEELSAGRPAFIAADGGHGSAMISMVATSLQGGRVDGEDAAGLARSWR